MKVAAWLAALAAMGASVAHAYCVQNELRDRPIVVEQEPHPDKLRGERIFRHTIPPGGKQCCKFHDLDCNPGGRQNSVVNLSIRIPGEPPYACGFPEGAEPNVKVTGGGTLRVLPNSRKKSAYPYVVRVRTHDRKDLTGPRGLVCPPAPKGY
jgi:hypothetical protein